VGDIAAHAAKVVQLLTDREAAATMATAARETAVKRFSTGSVIPQYEAYYRRLM
jgi:hypothetical protein